MLIAVLMGLAMVGSCSKDGDDDNKGGSSSDPLQNYVGTWEVVHSEGYRMENGIVVDQWDTDVSSEHNRIVFGADGTWTFYEYSSSRGTWHEDGKGSYYMRDGQIVVAGAMENFELISLSTNEIVMEYEYSEDKGSTYVKKHYHDTMRRITPSSSDIYESGGNSSSGSGGSSSGGSSSGGSSSGGGSSYSGSDTEIITCSLCSGSGKCRYCHGKGYSGTASFGSTCFLCKGSGKCTSCDGHGYKEVAVNPNSGGNSGGGSSGGSNNNKGSKCVICGGTGECSSGSIGERCYGSGVCGYCDGKGVATYNGVKSDCHLCDGTGKCSWCHGSGDCYACNGTGYK